MTVGVALIGGELEEAQSLAVVLGEAAAAISIEHAKIVLCGGVALIRREPVKARGLAGVLGKASAAGFIEIAETGSRVGEGLVGG